MLTFVNCGQWALRYLLYYHLYCLYFWNISNKKKIDSLSKGEDFIPLSLFFKINMLHSLSREIWKRIFKNVLENASIIRISGTSLKRTTLKAQHPDEGLGGKGQLHLFPIHIVIHMFCPLPAISWLACLCITRAQHSTWNIVTLNSWSE